jgi:hypothetical protein
MRLTTRDYLVVLLHEYWSQKLPAAARRFAYASVAILLAACAADSATNTSSAPSIFVSTGYNGIRDVTPFPFSLRGGPKTGESYAWDFGDGTHGMGGEILHTYTSEGTFTVTLSVSGSGGAFTTSGKVTVGTLSGVWLRDAVEGVRHRLEITQHGNELEGVWWVLYDPDSPFATPADSNASPLTGTVNSFNDIQLMQNGDCERTIKTGTVTPDVTIIGGGGEYGNPACGVGAAAWHFRRKDVPGLVY